MEAVKKWLSNILKNPELSGKFCWAVFTLSFTPVNFRVLLPHVSAARWKATWASGDSPYPLQCGQTRGETGPGK